MKSARVSQDEKDATGVRVREAVRCRRVHQIVSNGGNAVNEWGGGGGAGGEGVLGGEGVNGEMWRGRERME